MRFATTFLNTSEQTAPPQDPLEVHPNFSMPDCPFQSGFLREMTKHLHKDHDELAATVEIIEERFREVMRADRAHWIKNLDIAESGYGGIFGCKVDEDKPPETQALICIAMQHDPGLTESEAAVHHRKPAPRRKPDATKAAPVATMVDRQRGKKPPAGKRESRAVKRAPNVVDEPRIDKFPRKRVIACRLRYRAPDLSEIVHTKVAMLVSIPAQVRSLVRDCLMTSCMEAVNAGAKDKANAFAALWMLPKCVLFKPSAATMPMKEVAKIIRKRSDGWTAGDVPDLWRAVQAAGGIERQDDRRRAKEKLAKCGEDDGLQEGD